MRCHWIIIACFTVMPIAFAQTELPPSLKVAGVEPTVASIQQYLKDYQSAGEARETYGRWIQQLGDESFAKREQATFQLMKAKIAYFDMLEAAVKSKDAEISFRAERALKHLKANPPAKRQADILRDVLKVVVDRKIKGLAPALLGLMPRLDDSLARSAERALSVTLQTTDAELLRTTMSGEHVRTRCTAIRALPIAMEEQAAIDLLIAQLRDKDEQVQLTAAHTLADMGSPRALAPLQALLNSSDAKVRFRSVHILRYFSGKRFGFSPRAGEKDAKNNADAVKQWLAWIDGEGQTAKLNFPIKRLGVDTEGLVFHGRFQEAALKDGKVSDRSSQGNHAILMNTKLTDTSPVGGGCLMAGSKQYVVIPNNAALELTKNITLSVWVKLDSFGPGGYGNEEGHILKKGDPGWWNPTYGLAIRKKAQLIRFILGHPKKAINGGGKIIQSKTKIELKKWYQITGTYDGQTSKLYINGKLEAETTYNGTLRQDKAPVMLGGGRLFSTTGFSNHFAIRGTVDDVRIYSRALSEDEVGVLAER